MIGRVAELAKEHPSLPRHAINSDEDLSPTEIGKTRDDIVKAAWTVVSQLSTIASSTGSMVGPPVEVKCGGTAVYTYTERAVFELVNPLVEPVSYS